MVLKLGTGDEKLVSEMSDEELIAERNFYNQLLGPAYFVDSGKYDTIATLVKELEAEINRREHDGPPWIEA